MRLLPVLLGLVLLLAACDAAAPGTDAAQVVEQYLQAKVAADGEALRPLLCADLEADFEREANSFSGVEASIEGLACTQDSDSDTVSCDGTIVAVYDGENRDFPLTRYRVVQEDGAWKWCGVAQ